MVALKADIVVADITDLANDKLSHVNKYAVWTFLMAASALQIPFNFFLGKEFLLTLYDELKHRSLSKKIQDFKYGLSSERYSPDKLKKVRH